MARAHLPSADRRIDAFLSRVASRRLFAQTLSVFLAALLVAGCGSLLPRSASQTQSRWKSFEQARDAIQSLVPYKTRLSEVGDKGFDPYKDHGVSLLSFSDILQRFASSSALRREDFDPGIRDCLSAGKRCTGFAVTAASIKRKRIGNFWLDSLNFFREVEIVGWQFNALIIVVDDTVVYTLFSGQPRINQREVTRNPLGPLQVWGEQAPRLVR
ncbi:MAG: hypothetical protein VW339_11325 [Quisquiliibacterium sp.]